MEQQASNSPAESTEFITRSKTCPDLRNVVDQRYTLRNLSTGEELDLRDENKAQFVKRMLRLVMRKADVQSLETH